MIESVAAWPKSGTKAQQKCAKKQAKALAALHISFLLHIISVHMPLACKPCPWEQGSLGRATRHLSSAVTYIGQGVAGRKILSSLTLRMQAPVRCRRTFLGMVPWAEEWVTKEAGYHRQKAH